jgi:transposase
MSLRPEEIGSVPEETVRVTRASFPKGNRYMRLRDALGIIFEDSEFKDLFALGSQGPMGCATRS